MMVLLLLNYVVLRALWKIDVHLISTLVNKSLYYYYYSHCFCLVIVIANAFVIATVIIFAFVIVVDIVFVAKG